MTNRELAEYLVDQIMISDLRLERGEREAAREEVKRALDHRIPEGIEKLREDRKRLAQAFERIKLDYEGDLCCKIDVKVYGLNYEWKEWLK